MKKYILGVVVIAMCFAGIAYAFKKRIADTILQPQITTDQTPHDTDDPAIWINKSHPEQSLVIGTDKDSDGGLYVFDLSGKNIQQKNITGLKRPNNVDIAYNFQLNGKRIDIAAVTERETNLLRIFSVPDMQPADGGGIPVFEGEKERKPMGIAIYTRKSDNAQFAIVSRKSGPSDGYLWEYQLSDDGAGHIKGEVVRKFGKYSGKKEIESVAIDDELGYVYYSDEGYGVHKYYADPEKGNTELAVFGNGDFKEDIEGISIYKLSPSIGYILVSDQQANRFVVFPREGAASDVNQHLKIAAINTATVSSDGSDITNINLGSAFPKGMFVAMSEKRIFQFYDWRSMEKQILGNSTK